MSRRTVLVAFREEVEPKLKTLGFEGRRGHLIRVEGPITQAIELQYSIYGGRVTANLGLDLTLLKPLVRWIARPAIGPHAHDCTRWIRIGLVRPERSDHWWSFEPESEQAAVRAVRALGQTIFEHGLSWLDSEGQREAFLRYARGRIDRGRCPERPHGTYLDLRLCAAVLAWNGELEEARSYAELARACWGDERERLIAARAEFQKTTSKTRMPSVPDIQRELDELISTTKASLQARDPSREAPSRRRSRSARL